MTPHLDSVVLDAARAACVALPAAGLPRGLGRLRSRGWALVAPISIVAVLLAGAHAATWTALLLVPPGCALALGWAAHGARPWLAVLAVPLLVAAPVSDGARIVLLAAVATFAFTLVFDQLFLVVDELPATVPPAVVMLAFARHARRRPAAPLRLSPARSP